MTENFNINKYNWKATVLEKLGLSKNDHEIFNSGRIFDRLVNETGYIKTSRKFSPKQLKIIDEEIGGLTDDF
jgi:hypothetical protein